ncbi:hypothetical protein HF888_02555 [Bermanella marisrubri]|nr:DUF6351 family protein [Bermanella marisrubri]QIZ83178.1 hypothetical protein HF888_02555 [Bermanella marisrubri]
MKRLLLSICLSVALLLSLGVFYDRLEQQFLPKSSQQLLQGLPQQFAIKANQIPYSGPHPRKRVKPEESFPFPIEFGEVGPIEPLFAGANEYPFLCGTQQSGLGQPLVDNQDGVGVAVYAESEDNLLTNEIIGFSKDCLLPTRIQYFVLNDNGHGYRPVERLSDLEDQVTEVIRVEIGTINRFIYVIAIPVGRQDQVYEFDGHKWNQRLIYRMKGGVGVGREQGHIRVAKLLYEHQTQLEEGYAIAYSTGTETSHHYNIWLSEDTALRVKHQFMARYGVPLYTIAIGGSGGAIQQYLLAQNHPGLFDGLIPLYSYPDMVSQVSYALDCELLQYYFDVISPQSMWREWENRRLVEGSQSISNAKNRYGSLQAMASALNVDFRQFPSGASICTNGWRGPAQHINNPIFFTHYYEIHPGLRDKVDWSHWGNLAHIYGTDGQGFGNRFWGNKGVQYGLMALRRGEIDMPTFLAVNRSVGGWKPLGEMRNARFWHISGDDSFRRLSVWSEHNMTHDQATTWPQRTSGNASAARAAYDAGLVFLGLADVPIIDLRHYLEPDLDMHHSLASFVSRARIDYAMGRSDHHLIWMMEKPKGLSRREIIRSLPIDDALRLLDQWIINRQRHPQQDLWQSRPNTASDRCYDQYQHILAQGSHVWDGNWNNSEKQGACQQRFPHYQQSRMLSGESIYGDVLLCDRISIDEAVERGVYGNVDVSPFRELLTSTFPDGVCDYPEQPHRYVRQLIDALE